MPRQRRQVRVAHLAFAHKPHDVRIFEKECRSLADAGYDVHLIVANTSEGAVHAGVSMHSIEVPNPGHALSKWKARFSSIKRIARNLRADIYHVHEPELIPVGLFLKRNGARVIYDAHEDAPLEAWSLNYGHHLRRLALPGLWWGLLTLARFRFDAFVAATPRIARKFPSAKTIEVRNYPRTELFSGQSKPGFARKQHAIFAGLVSRTRGAVEMLNMLAALHDESAVRLRLFGTIDSRELGKELREHPGWKRVDFFGHRPWCDVLEEYSHATAGLLLYAPTPEQRWALPVKLFEFLFAGLPVIASDIFYWREILDGNPAVVFVPHGDTLAAARAMTHLADLPGDEMQQLGQAGIDHALTRYSWKSEGERLVALYDRLFAIQPQD